MEHDEGMRRSLPLATPLSNAADVAFDRIAGLVRTVIGTPVALVSLVDQDRQVFPGAVGLPEPWQTDRRTPLSHSFCQHVVARREPLVIEDARRDSLVATNLAIPDLGVVAYAGMPLHDRAGRVVGSLCAIDTEPRQWTSSELDLLADLAQTCSAELQLRDVADRAEHEAARTRLLLDLSEVLSATTIEQVAELVSRISRTRLGAASATVTVLDEFAGQLRHRESADTDETVRVTGRAGVDDNRPSAVAICTGKPLFLATAEDLADLSPGAAPEGAAVASAHLPMQLGATVFGTIDLTWSTEQPFTQDDRDMLVGFVRYAAGALDRAMLLADRRDVAATLQRAMLPDLPSLDWVQIAGTYRPASTADAVGGDWYDAFTLKSTDTGSDREKTERLVLVVGDVTGHDTAAAAIMGRVQAGLRYLALDAPCTPGALLERLDRIMTRTAHTSTARMATAVTASLDRPGDAAGSDGVEFTWSNAGHLPPLLLAPGAAPRYLVTPIDLLLGLDSTVRRHSHVELLPPGATVLLFTDGLVERRDASLDDGLATLARIADRNRDLPLHELVDTIADAVLTDRHDDDTVLLGIRMPG